MFLNDAETIRVGVQGIAYGPGCPWCGEVWRWDGPKQRRLRHDEECSYVAAIMRTEELTYTDAP